MNILTVPAATDMHVHFRDPGQTYKEDLRGGMETARRSGVAAVLCMPNTVPPVDSVRAVTQAVARSRTEETRNPAVAVFTAAAVTVGQKGRQLTDFAALKAAGAAALSDDGLPVIDDTVMEAALKLAHSTGLPLIAHCEPETEMIARDIALVRKTGAPLHFAHVSLASSLALIRAAKNDGLPITCESCPHYFTFTRERADLMGADARMNPPLASDDDVEAVRRALADGTVDCITTDHAPHHWTEKARPSPPNGVLGLETLWPATLTALYCTQLLSLDRIVDLLCHAPRRILGLGAQRTMIHVDMEFAKPYQPDTNSRCRSTPFAGYPLRGRVSTLI